jgi:hypothetical protein
MKVHIQLSDSLADKLLEEGLTGLPNDFAETIRNNAVKRSEIIKLVIQRHLAKLEAPSMGDLSVGQFGEQGNAEGDEA